MIVLCLLRIENEQGEWTFYASARHAHLFNKCTDGLDNPKKYGFLIYR